MIDIWTDDHFIQNIKSNVVIRFNALNKMMDIRTDDHFIQSNKSNYHILKDNGKIGGIFVPTPIYSSKQPPNLRQPIIRNTITDILYLIYY